MLPLFDLQDKVVAIAGAAGAFGSTIAEELVARGCRVSLFDKNEGGLEDLANRLESNQVSMLGFDATEEEKCKMAFQSCVDRWTRIDGFVNCVGLFEIISADKMPYEVFSRLIQTNLNAAFLLCRSAAKHMIPNGFGRIINIASVSDSVANPGYAAYASSKAALTHLTRVLAIEWAQHSITVNAISPAMSETNLTTSFLSQGDNRDDALSRIPMNRLFTPSDILATVILLLSSGGSFITGQAIHIDGGRTIS